MTFVFDRKQAAELLGVSYAVIRNWAIGKPITIEPSVRSPGVQGSMSLYSLSDIYRMGIAMALLSEQGIDSKTVDAILKGIQDEWLAPDDRDYLAINLKERKVRSFHPKDDGRSLDVMEVVLSGFGLLLDIKPILMDLDQKIGKVLQKKRK